jgi:hypothetical protein
MDMTKKIITIAILLCVAILVSGCTSKDNTPTKIEDDDQWVDSTNAQVKILKADLEEIGNHPDSLSVTQQCDNDIQNSIVENDRYIVTSKYQSAQHEWQLALTNYHSGMQDRIQILNGVGDNETLMKDLNNSIDIGSEHLTQFSNEMYGVAAGDIIGTVLDALIDD